MKFEQLTRFARGFVYAYNGIRAAVQEERNFRFHLCAAFYAFVAAFWAELDPVETALIALCVAAVLALELVNSAIERAVDKPRHHPLVERRRGQGIWAAGGSARHGGGNADRGPLRVLAAAGHAVG